MSYQQDTIDWQSIDFIDRWLDNEVSEPYTNAPLAQDWARISKIAEEVGEAIQAFIGYTGQNPRKSYTHSSNDMLGELADVVLTGILAIEHFTKDPSETRQIIMNKIAASTKRIRS